MSEGTVKDTGVPSLEDWEDQSTEDCLEQDLNISLEEQAREITYSSVADTRDEMAVADLALKQEDPSIEVALKLLPKARRLDLKNMVDKLANVLMKGLSLDNCVAVFRSAYRYELDDLQDASHDMICRNFTSVSETNEEFCKLSLEEVSMLVFSDMLDAREEEVFDAIVRWTETDLERRHSLVPRLLPAVRINRCSLRFLQSTMTHFLVQNDKSYLRAARERIRLLISSELCYESLRMAARTGGTPVVFVMGGCRNVDTVETLDPARDSWVSHDLPEAPSDWTWIGSMGHRILVLEWENERFRSFDVLTMSWSVLQSPPCYTFGSSRSCSDHQVFILGGEEPHDNLCFRYDIRTDQWEQMNHLRLGRIWAASVSHAGKLYCSGGLSTLKESVSYSMEVLDLWGYKIWSFLPSMGVRRSCHCMVFCDRFLWVIGGWFRGESLSAVEKFDVVRCQWSSVRPLPAPTNLFSTSVLEGRIHVIGGEIGGSTSVYVYDEADEEWTSAESLHVGRCLHGSCVVLFESDEAAELYAAPIL